MLWDVLSTDPATNGTRPPPSGAPQDGTDIGDISAILRWLMAGAAEVAAAIDAILTSLKGMAFQSPAAVAITGGSIAGATIGSTNNIAAAALTSGVLDPARIPSISIIGAGLAQAIFDAQWPVGSQRAFNSADPAGLTPAGLSATWTRITAAEDALLAGVGATRPYGGQGSGTAVGIGSAGSHNHGGNTGGLALNLAGLPTGVVTGVTFATPTDNPQQANFGTQQSLDAIFNPAGGQTHNHPISSDGGHTHTLTMPAVWSTYWYERTA